MFIRNKRGSAIPLVIVIAGLVSVMSYVTVSMLQSRRSSSEDDLRVLQAKMLAADLVELGKYFILYERLIFLDDPLSNDANRAAIRREFLQQSYGSLASANAFMINVCGGYDSNAVEVGTFKAAGAQVFCPYYLRNPLMDGHMFEDMMLTMWSRNGVSGELTVNGDNFVTRSVNRDRIMTKDASGGYVMEMDFSDSIKSSDDQFIRLHLNQNIIRTMRQNGFSAKLKFSFYGPSSGFKTLSNERYVNVQADVTFGSAFSMKSVNTAESLIVYSTSVKDFALFMMYPEDVSGNRTTQFSQAVKIGNSSRVNGRVFFNGDIDTPLDQLPTFSETVVISGDVNTAGFTYDQAKNLISQKFPKGIVTRFPVTRLINDGPCIPGYNVSNGSGMDCKSEFNHSVPFNAQMYIQRLNNLCSNLTVTYGAGVYNYDVTSPEGAAKKELCHGSAPKKIILSGGANRVNVSGSHAYVISPVKTFIASGSTNIYGTILGGYVQSGNNSKFYSMTALRTGLPGIPDENSLRDLSLEAERVMAGVGVPLVNLTLVKEAGIGN